MRRSGCFCSTALFLLRPFLSGLFKQLIEEFQICLMNSSNVRANSLERLRVGLLHDLDNVSSILLPSRTDLQLNPACEVRVRQTSLNSQSGGVAQRGA